MTATRRMMISTIAVLAVLGAAGCVRPRPAGEPGPFRVDILVGDARAVTYGRTAAEALAHPELGEEIRALFGPDWTAGTGARVGLSAAAGEFFSKPFESRVIRLAGQEWVAGPGCMARACGTHRALLLVRVDGAELMARVDDGGFTHYYVRGIGLEATPERRAMIDAAWRAMRETGGWARGTEPVSLIRAGARPRGLAG